MCRLSFSVKTLLFVFVFWRNFLHCVTLPNRGLCRRLKYYQPLKGFSLKGHMIKNLSIGIDASCKNLCTLESHCVSFNLGPPVKDRMVCELSNSDDTLHPEHLILREGFVYRGTQNACSNNPCSNNGTCLNGFTDKGYLCECKAGYTGKQCQKTGEQFQKGWKMINNVSVCFGARDDTYGTFNIRERGLIYTFKLVHKNGSVSCNTKKIPPSHWGCDRSTYGNKKLLTVITYPNKTALPLADYLRDEGGCGEKYYSYEIAGIGVNSPELVFNNFSTPLAVSNGQEFQIWEGQDLMDCSEFNNGGQTCVDVYALYC